MGYLETEINVGGETITRGRFIADMQAANVPHGCIDRYLQGNELASKISNLKPGDNDD